MSDADDLARVTFEWAAQWWDPAEHMVWNPPGSLHAGIEARQVHLVPNTAWLAYALLAAGDDAAWAEGVAAIRALIGLQYDRPGTVVHGTYRRFLEWPEPPDEPVMWEHYDPNWRQFVGTAFAVILEDFPERLGTEVVAVIEASIRLACDGEPERRISPSYSNPALMHAWLDAWCGARAGDERLVERGRAFARAIVADFDRFGEFDEFNSPTYYGIDLYALRLWRLFAPDPYFAEQGERLESELWRSAGAFYNANLRNSCGPFTRSYHPDATRSVTLFSLWIWALLGHRYAPLPPIGSEVVEHGHDLMAGPLFARLAGEPTGTDLAAFRSFGGSRQLAQELARGRHVSAWIGSQLMIGAESSDIDWGGWEQFMPATAHWRSRDAGATLWLVDAHVVRAEARDRELVIEAASEVDALRFHLCTSDVPIALDAALAVAGVRVEFTSGVSGVSVAEIGPELYEIRTVPSTPGRVRCTMRFQEVEG